MASNLQESITVSLDQYINLFTKQTETFQNSLRQLTTVDKTASILEEISIWVANIVDPDKAPIYIGA